MMMEMEHQIRLIKIIQIIMEEEVVVEEVEYQLVENIDYQEQLL
jgi:hypothetical protein